MNREIKFRIWDDAPIKDGLKGIMINYEYAIKSSYLIDALSGKYPIMQYTGLKDKKGVEIYEGDILESELGNLFLVDFRKGCWTLIHEPTTGSEREGQPKTDYLHGSIEMYGLEVVGNLHENPELLNQPI